MYRALDGADVVRPQNVFTEWPWHARWDFGGDPRQGAHDVAVDARAAVRRHNLYAGVPRRAVRDDEVGPRGVDDRDVGRREEAGEAGAHLLHVGTLFVEGTVPPHGDDDLDREPGRCRVVGSRC